MRNSKLLGAVVAAGLSVMGWSQSASALVIDWVDWVSASPGTVSGNLVGGTVGVTYTGPNGSPTQTGTGTNFWTESNPANRPYTANAIVDNAPTPSEQIALVAAGTHIIDFAQAVLNPLIAFSSWNSNTLTLLDGATSTVLSHGQGFWGTGSLIDTGIGFTATGGEPHGVLQLNGSFTQIRFTNARFERWHGFTIGVEGLATNDNDPIPEPGTLALFGFGLAGLGFARRRKAA